MRNSFNVKSYWYGQGALKELKGLLEQIPGRHKGVVYCVDHYFKGSALLERLPIISADMVCFVDTTCEPKTTDIDELYQKLQLHFKSLACVVGLGGGSTLDTAKAISNLWTNGGRAQDYQGWDLLKKPGVYKIGIPTVSGTGAESSKTCVMTNPDTGLKLGMNSEYTVFDQIILDPDLTATVPRDQYFFSGMDTFIHCIESLNGRYRNAIGDAFSRQALALCQEVFTSENMQSLGNREKLMVASYLGGCAIANSFVGLVHPLSAGLSVVFGEHHCLANCIVMNSMEEFYPKETEAFQHYMHKQGIVLPVRQYELNPEVCNQLYAASIVHEKPLANALGDSFKLILTPEKVRGLYQKMV